MNRLSSSLLGFSRKLLISAQLQASTMSQVRQNFHENCENAINSQINMELFASYTYLSMAYYMDRVDIALPGLHKYFLKASSEEKEHAMKLMKYQNKRGGLIIYKDIIAPIKADWGTPLEAMEEALNLEKKVNKSLLKIHFIGGEHGDANLCDFIEEFLEEQVDSMKEIGDHVTNLKRVGDGLGVYMFDKHFQEE